MSVSVPLSKTNLSLVAPLTSFNRVSLGLSGGKGANLGELFRAGFDVPAGFVITTAAYDLLLQTDGLQGRIQEKLVSMQTDHLTSVAKIS